jgi:outer membrane immunogenic protein
MKRMFLASVSALAVLSAVGAANAADLARRHQMAVKAPVYAPAVYNWTGFYVGINGGGAWGTSNWSNPLGGSSFNANGALIGGTAGYNWQMGQAVFGVEGDVDWSSIKGTGPATCVVAGCETKNNWLGTFRGRLCYAFDRVLPYVTGGLAVGDIKANSALGSASETRAGWTVGGGVEAAITGPLTAKIEYLYADLGSMNCATTVCGGAVATNVNYHANIVRAGLNYHF